MAQCKRDVTPLLTHWSYVSFASSHRYEVTVVASWAVMTWQDFPHYWPFVRGYPPVPVVGAFRSHRIQGFKKIYSMNIHKKYSITTN